MNKPAWLVGALLATTSFVLPVAASAQDNPQTLPPQPTDETAAPADDLSPEDDPLEAQADDQAGPDVSIPGAIFVTGRRIRDVARSSDQVVSVLSTEDIARTGEGDIAGALTRVTGLSVVGGGYVYVRGLGDRYSLALLNGLPLPSPEPLKRVVPLDIFPTNVVASSLVQKSYSVNFPGEFGGGAINLTTVAVPDESFLSIGAGISADTETTFHFGYSYFGSDTDWSGFDNGRRDVPPSLANYFASGLRIDDAQIDHDAIANELIDADFAVVQKLKNVPVNFSGSITGGTAFDMGEARVGIVLTGSYGNDWTTRDIQRDTPGSLDLSSVGDTYRYVNTNNNITANAMLGLGVEIGEHKFRLTNLFIRDTIKETRLGDGIENATEYERLYQDTAWIERQLIDSQFVGELRFGDLGIDLRGGYANTQRESPFETHVEYFKSHQSGDPYGEVWVNNLDNGFSGAATVAFSNLNEDLWYGGIDVSLLATDRINLTAGYSYTDQSRTSSRREFQILGQYPDYIGLLRIDSLVSPDVISAYNFEVIESTTTDPAFAASLKIHGAYAKVNWEPIDFVTLDLGVRYETADQFVEPIQVFQIPSGSQASNLLSNDYWLPAATITWEVTPEFQVRINGSKTIARPQFRELIPQLFYDPESNRSYRGNPYLVDSKLTNAELRGEYYFGRSNRISAAGFYKKLDRPIETYVSVGGAGSVASFANAPSADLYGVELEAVKYVPLFDSRRAFLIGNYTYTKSKIKVGPDDTSIVYPTGEVPATYLFIDGTPLTGQSEHVANLQVGLEDENHLSQQTILINYSSERILARNSQLFPPLTENPGLRIDFVARQGVNLFGLDTEWKFEARNIFGRKHEEYYELGENRIQANSWDVGTKFSLSVSANF